MPGLRVISQQHQGHASHVSNVVKQRIVRQSLLLGGRRRYVNERCHRHLKNHTTREAKDFVVARIVEEAQCEGTALSELERKIKDVFSNNLYS
jgi:hypothetical protein